MIRTKEEISSKSSEVFSSSTASSKFNSVIEDEAAVMQSKEAQDSLKLCSAADKLGKKLKGFRALTLQPIYLYGKQPLKLKAADASKRFSFKMNQPIKCQESRILLAWKLEVPGLNWNFKLDEAKTQQYESLP